jgi:hypothetical protein
MTLMKKMLLSLAVAVASVGVVVGCDTDQPATTASPAQPTAESAAALPSTLFLKKAPEGAVEVAAAKKSVKPGDDVVVRGRVAGSVDPLAPNRAILTLLDNGVPTCEKSPMDKCPTPWDACCESRETLQASTATIQIVDSGGKPIKTTLRGLNGIEPMKEVTVVGKVRDAGGANTLVIDATGVYVKSS